MRLIDIDDLIEAHYAACENDHSKSFETWSLELMKNAPTIDAEPVVRCKYCANSGEHDSELPMVYCHAFERWVHEEFYCESREKMDGVSE